MKISISRLSALTKRYFFYICGSIFSGLIQGIAFGNFGVFEDSANYYLFYQNVGNIGLIDAVLNFGSQTSKFEPLMFLIFQFEHILFDCILTEQQFLMVNMILLNFLISSVMFPLLSRGAKSSAYLFGVGFVVVSGYLIFSKEMYVWRSIIAFVFFVLFLIRKNGGRWIWATVSVLSHTSFLLFVCLFYAIETASKLRKPYLLWFLGGCVACSSFIVPVFPEIFRFAVVDGDMSLFFSQSSQHSTNAWVSVLFSFFVLILVQKEFLRTKALRPMYLFCLLTTISGLLSYGSYHYMLRTTVPASIMTGFFPFIATRNSVRIWFARLSVALSVMPTLRIVMALSNGTFLS